jgi:hypothetical protein
MTHDLSDPTTLSLLRMVGLGLVPDLFGPSMGAAPGQTPTAPDLTDTVSAVGALQSQDWNGALHTLATRDRNHSLVAVRRAFDGGGLVRTWPMRGTLHTVAAADLPWLLSATRDRTGRLTARRRAQLGISEQVLENALEVAHRMLSLRRCTRGEVVEEWRSEGLIEEVPGRAYHLFMTLCYRGHLALGPIGPDGGQLVVELSVAEPIGDPLTAYVRRYFTSHGPATLEDLARWSGLTKTVLKRYAIAARDRGELASTVAAGRELWHRPGLDAIPGDVLDAAARMVLLSGFDELILGYRDRSCTLAPELETRICPGGNGMFKHTIVEGGRVVGTWRRDRTGDPVPEFFATATKRRLKSFGDAVRRMPA